MALKQNKGSTPSRRFMSGLDYSLLTKSKPEKSLIQILPKKSARDRSGHISVRHQGGREKRFLRIIDFKRDKRELPARVVAIEYDPNRTANLALLVYPDGEKRYILEPLGLKIGDEIVTGEKAELKPGNALPIGKIPIGIPVHNVEIIPGQGGQMVKSAGTSAAIVAHEERYTQIKMPSGEIRRIAKNCYATIGQIGNIERKNIVLGKAGRKRHLGIRPTVRGTAQNPRTHPHGGGEGRSGIGMPTPKTPWGKPARKKTRKKRKYSDKMIIQRRK